MGLVDSILDNIFGMGLMAKDEPGVEAAFILNELYMGD